VDTLEIAHRLQESEPGTPIATLAGDFLTREGIARGGSASDSSNSVLQRQNEIRELRELTESLHEEVASRQERRDDLNRRVDALEETLLQARERLQQKRVQSSTLEGKLALVDRDISQIANKVESLEWEKSETESRQEGARDGLGDDEKEHREAQARVHELDLQGATVSEHLAEARTREERLNEDVTEARTSLAVERGMRENLEENRLPMANRLRELDELIERRGAEIAEFRIRIERSATETAELQHQIEQWEITSAQHREEAERIAEERTGYAERIEAGEEELTRLRREVQDVAARRGKEEVKIAQIDIQIQNVENLCRERYRTELEYFEPDSHALLAAIESRKNNGRQRKSGEARADTPGSVDGESESGGEPNGEAAIAEPANAAPSQESSDHENETPADATADVALEDPAEPDWAFVEETVAQLRTKLDSMGPVNLDAISEFDELEEHYRFNMNQLEDLENSREELLRMIARINRNTRKMFADTFEQVRRNFRDMFKELFGERSKADLVLLDDADPLECGIDIIAKPPGKKLQSISLLSGGERSMTAVALLFGIYMVKPSPFCVLDELDAPLDEANIGRFLKVLDRFIGESQFVIVTHSKRTMSRADVIYGVSMEEFGVSKTVGVQFSKAGEEKGLSAAPVGG